MMGFLNTFILYFLPLSLFPLILMFIKGKRTRKKYLSWIFLITEEEAGRKRLNIEKSLIVLLRVLFLLTLIFFLAGPLPQRYNFTGVFIDTSLSMAAKKREVQKLAAELKEIYGKKVSYFSDRLKDTLDFGGRTDFSLLPSNCKILLLTDFQMSGFRGTKRTDSEIFLDTLLVKNAGITKVMFDSDKKRLEIRIKNYNSEKVERRCVIQTGDGEILFDTTVTVSKGVSLTLTVPLSPINPGEKLTVKLLPCDDFPWDNECEFTLPGGLQIPCYIDGYNKYVEKFCKSAFGITDNSGASLIVAVDKFRPLRKENKVMVFFVSKPYAWLKMFGVENYRSVKEFTYGRWYIKNGVVFKGDNILIPEGGEDGPVICRDVNGRRLIFVGFVPDPKNSTFQYSPFFWSTIYAQVMEKLNPDMVHLAYTTRFDTTFLGRICRKKNGIFLILPDTIETNTEVRRDFTSLFKKCEVIDAEVIIGSIKRLRLIFAILLVLLFITESFLTYRYLRPR